MDTGGTKPSRRHHRRRCLLISGGIVLALVLLLVILGVTLFRVREATTTINSVKLDGLGAGFNFLNPSADLNVTLDIDLTAYNPNRVRFRYGEGSAELFYRGGQIGEAEIPPGEIGARGSARMVVTVTIFAGRLIGDSAVYADVLSGSVDFETSTRIPGRVTVLGIFKHHIVSYTSCDVTLNVGNRTVEKSSCRYKAKL
ncbi:hypothetical protein AXF42_Ash008853 [Apostasia shenzhenica]|uniref:Late embryogenesis abundant protein LEA-2 subgroup domain-containing protein n=1 Tax=Apostasia shenzhenica TaxID=1088818 RepID=A0A2I0ASV1_9ASPA|nr:hypothetical protein AXF42_Ash008853 [Apostasia shenzhenica]